ncbi:NAD(P) transhydrogenase subunit alpha [Mongoliimonas terrestris]|uniref:NAD(P) transhydrogenase subunit alpha n=1 Tax=Mongoliimonas terrestris TaxID=1709001 RepID=UPI0009494E80|nr:proton-translocating transhydrogenase family protein [Mongoliimonas terrestris]
MADTISAEQAIEQARQAADAALRAANEAREAANAASAAIHSTGGFDTAADGLAHAASAATGGVIDPFVFRLSIFVLAIFVGYYVVWSVTPALHTPLMAVTNAISSVIIVGALLAVGVQLMEPGTGVARGFGFVAVVLAAVNIFGGFLVTSRMLAMYKKKS